MAYQALSRWTGLAWSHPVAFGLDLAKKYYGYFWSTGVAIRCQDTKNINNYWHWCFGPILSNFGCLEVSFAESSLLSLATCFRGTSYFGPNLAQNGHFWPNMAFFGPFDPMPNQKTIMWIPKCLLTPTKNRIFGPYTAKFGPFRPIWSHGWPKNDGNKVRRWFFRGLYLARHLFTLYIGWYQRCVQQLSKLRRTDDSSVLLNKLNCDEAWIKILTSIAWI